MIDQSKAIKWFNRSSFPSTLEGFLRVVVALPNKAQGVIVHVDMRGAPYFNCLFEIMPLSISGDLGSGPGVRHTVKF